MNFVETRFHTLTFRLKSESQNITQLAIKNMEIISSMVFFERQTVEFFFRGQLGNTSQDTGLATECGHQTTIGLYKESKPWSREIRTWMDLKQS